MQICLFLFYYRNEFLTIGYLSQYDCKKIVFVVVSIHHYRNIPNYNASASENAGNVKLVH